MAVSGWTPRVGRFMRVIAMRKFSLWIALVILAGVAYVAWPTASGVSSGSSAADSSDSPSADPAPVQVPFLVKSKTRQIFEEWTTLSRARSTGDREAVWVKINLALEAIRQRLHRDGAYAPGAMREAMLTAASEIGYDEQGAAHVIGTVLGGHGGAQSSGGVLSGVIGRALGGAAPPTAADEPER